MPCTLIHVSALTINIVSLQLYNYFSFQVSTDSKHWCFLLSKLRNIETILQIEIINEEFKVRNSKIREEMIIFLRTFKLLIHSEQQIMLK